MGTMIGQKNKFYNLIATLLIIVVGLAHSVDLPEGFEVALQSKQRALVDLTQAPAVFTQQGSFAEDDVFTDAKKRRKKYYDEDFIIFWLGVSHPRPSLKQRINDASASKYRSFYSLGTLSWRHLLLVKYRDFVDLTTQQYGRSLH